MVGSPPEVPSNLPPFPTFPSPTKHKNLQRIKKNAILHNLTQWNNRLCPKYVFCLIVSLWPLHVIAHHTLPSWEVHVNQDWEFNISLTRIELWSRLEKINLPNSMVSHLAIGEIRGCLFVLVKVRIAITKNLASDWFL